MCRGFVAAIFLVLPASAAWSQDAAKADRHKLQGVWVLESVEWLGEKTDQNLDELDIRRMRLRWWPEKQHVEIDLKKYRTTLTVKESGFVHQYRVSTLDGRQRIIRDVGKYELDASKTPRVLRSEHSSSKWQYDDDYGDETTLGVAPRALQCIYSVEGDLLRCGWRSGKDSDRLPTTFATERDEDLFVFRYIREKK